MSSYQTNALPDVGRELLDEALLGHGADELLGDHAVLEDEQRRDRQDVEAGGDGGFSSTLSLPTVTASYSSATSLSTGSIMRHGPHQGAQKSSTNGLELPATVVSKFASVT